MYEGNLVLWQCLTTAAYLTECSQNIIFKFCLPKEHILFRELSARNEQYCRCSSMVMRDKACRLLGETRRRMGEHLGSLIVAI